MTRFLSLLAAIFLATTAFAQTYPDRTSPGVNDFAGVIDPDDEARIAEKLAAIKDDHGVEASVVTLSSLQFYAQDSSIEDYSQGLFNAWGLGDAEENNGILLMLFRDDREVRLEVGSGYDADMQKAFDQLIDEDILPDFRDGNLAAGLESGVDALVPRIISPPSANDAPATTDTSSDGEAKGGGNTLWYVLGGVGAAILGLIGLNRRSAAKFTAQPCSNCGQTGLERSRVVLSEATVEVEGKGETRITCPSCGHVDATPYTISKLKPEGGGKSEGSGSTGKW